MKKFGQKILSSILILLLISSNINIAFGQVSGSYLKLDVPNGALVPSTTQFNDFGSTTTRWNKIFTTDLDISGIFTFGGTVSGDLNMDGNSIINILTSVFDQTTTPANPGAGENKLFFKADNEIYKLDSSGNEIKLNSVNTAHGVLDPGTVIFSAGTPTSTYNAVAFDFYIDGVRHSFAGVTNEDPGFGVGQEFAYLGINEDLNIVTKIQDAFTAEELDNGGTLTSGKPILELGVIRSIVGGPGGTLDIITDSPYILDDSQKRIYVQSKFAGTDYDRSAGFLTKSSTDLRIDAAAGNFVNGNNEVGSIPATSTIAASLAFFNGTNYDIGAQIPLIIDNAQYNPGNSLVSIPTGKFVTHTILHSTRTNAYFMVYATETFDTFSEAVDAVEDLGPVAGIQVGDVNPIATVQVKEGESTIRNIKDIRHKIGAENLPTLTEGTQNISTTFDGSVREQFVLSYVESAGTIFAEIEQIGGGDLTFQLDGSSYILDATTNTGTGGKARVALTPGTGDTEQINHIYINLVANVATFQSATTEPSGDVAIVGQVNTFDSTRFLASGMLTSQEFNNAASITGQGFMTRSARRHRLNGPIYEGVGLDPTLTITTNGGAIDTVELASTSGTVSEFNKQTADSFSNSDTYTVLNHPTTPNLIINTLDELIVDANNVTLRSNNDRYGLTIIHAINTGADDIRYVLLPIGKYSTDANALADASNFAVTSVGSGLSITALRTYRVVLKFNTSGSGTLTNVSGGTAVQDERGFPLGQGGAGAGGAAQTAFSAGVFQIFDPTDATKIGNFNSASIATGTTRTMTFPDESGTICLIEATQTLTNKTMTGVNNTLTASLLKSATTEINVSSATAPTTGQVLTATSSTAATWQDAGGGGGITDIMFSRRNGNVSLANGDTLIVFNIEDADTDNNYNTSTGVYTIPTTGIYAIGTHVTLSGLTADDDIALSIKTTGAFGFIGTARGFKDTVNPTISVHTINVATAGDEISVTIKNATAARGIYLSGMATTYFYVYKLN